MQITTPERQLKSFLERSSLESFAKSIRNSHFVYHTAFRVMPLQSTCAQASSKSRIWSTYTFKQEMQSWKKTRVVRWIFCGPQLGNENWIIRHKKIVNNLKLSFDRQPLIKAQKFAINCHRLINYRKCLLKQLRNVIHVAKKSSCSMLCRFVSWNIYCYNWAWMCT